MGSWRAFFLACGLAVFCVGGWMAPMFGQGDATQSSATTDIKPSNKVMDDPNGKDLRAKENKIKKMVKPSEDGKSWTIETQHYVVTTRVSPEFTFDMGTFMDMWWDVFFTFFSGRTKIGKKAPVICWENYESFLAEEGVHPGVLGFFSPSDLQLHVFCNDSTQSFFSAPNYPLREVIKHEGTHQLFQYLVGGGQGADLPFWFNEGSATVFMCYNITRPPMLNIEAYFLQAMHFPSVMEYVETAAMPDISSINDLASGQAYQSTPAGMAYGRSAAFVSYMLQSKKGQDFFNKMWSDITHFKPLAKYFVSPAIDPTTEAARKDLMNKCAYFRSQIYFEHQAPEAKFHYLCCLNKLYKSKKMDPWAKTAIDCVNEFTKQNFTDAAQAWKWLEENREYLVYTLPKERVVTKGFDIRGEYEEDFERWVRLEGLKGAWTILEPAKKNKVPAERFLQLPAETQKGFDALDDAGREKALADAEPAYQTLRKQRLAECEAFVEFLSWLYGKTDDDFRQQCQMSFLADYLKFIQEQGGENVTLPFASAEALIGMSGDASGNDAGEDAPAE